MYKLIILTPAEDFLKRLYYIDKSHFIRIRSSLISLKSNPFKGKPLKHAFKGQYSLRVGFYRIIYKVDQRIITVSVADIGHRRNIYN